MIFRRPARAGLRFSGTIARLRRCDVIPGEGDVSTFTRLYFTNRGPGAADSDEPYGFDAAPEDVISPSTAPLDHLAIGWEGDSTDADTGVSADLQTMADSHRHWPPHPLAPRQHQ